MGRQRRLPQRFNDEEEEDEEDDSEMEVVPLPSSTEEAAIEPEHVPDVVTDTRKSGRQRRLPQRFIDKEQIATMLHTDDDTVMEDVQVPDVGPVTRKRGRPRKPQIVEKITNFVRR